MAKKKKAKKAADKSAKWNKAEIRAYYKEHGWTETMAHFSIAPKDLSPIVKGEKAADGPKKPPKKKKGKKVSEAAPKTPKKKKEKKKGKGKKKTAKSADAPYGYKKDGTPKKPPGRKSGKKASAKTKKADKKAAKKAAKAEAAPKAPKKKGGRPKGKKTPAPAASATTNDMVLDWLLSYRAKNQKAGHMLPLDSVIIDLTTKIRR